MRFRLVPIVLMVCSCAGVLACRSMPYGASSKESSTAFKLPSLPVPRDAVGLDILFVDRPAGDPLLGKILWRDIDQIGALSEEQRTALREAGIQVGHVGSSPPDALQALLNLADEESERHRREANGQTPPSSRRVIIPAGSDTEVCASEPVAARRLRGPDGQLVEIQDVRGVLRLRAERSQDGWARLEFVPELHHGANQTRPFAAATGWMLRTAQQVIPYFDQQFAVNLSVGEMVIITADREPSDSLGQQLFRFEDTTGAKQRLIVVRLAELREVRPKRIESN